MRNWMALLEKQFEGGVLGSEAQGGVEGEGGGVAIPGVEGDVVAALTESVLPDVLEKSAADVLPTAVLIDAEVVQVQTGDVLEAAA